MKRSRAVSLTLLTAVAAAAVACADTPEVAQTCVDGDDQVVPDSLCTPAVREQHTRAGGMFYGHPYPYRYYYGGSYSAGGAAHAISPGGEAAPVGAHVTGGSYTVPAGMAVHGAGVSRGGFGSTGTGHVGGHGG